MVSVVITVLNEASNIESLLDALFNQTKKPGEIIIVDGGSTDNTVKIIKKLASRNKVTKLLEKKGNRSVGRNWGINNAKGDIIAITDAGGYPKKDWLEKITSPFESKSISVVSGFYHAVANSVFQKCVTPYFLVMPDKVEKKMHFRPSSRSVAIRREVWKKVPYPVQYSHNEDLVWDIELEKAGYRFHFEPSAIVYWHPPQSLAKALKQFYRFAYGDAEAGVPRPKVFLIHVRWFLFWMLITLNIYFVLLLVAYGLWAVAKNWRYARTPLALFWLPVIQISSDFAIMVGYIRGRICREFQQ